MTEVTTKTEVTLATVAAAVTVVLSNVIKVTTVHRNGLKCANTA